MGLELELTMADIEALLTGRDVDEVPRPLSILIQAPIYPYLAPICAVVDEVRLRRVGAW